VRIGLVVFARCGEDFVADCLLRNYFPCRVKKSLTLGEHVTHHKSYMPRAESDFLAWARTIYDSCSQHATEWGLSPLLISQLSAVYSDADTAYQANLNQELKNRSTTSLKNAAFLVLKTFLSTFNKYLESNLDVPNEALIAMGLPSREHHAHLPIPIPTDAPVLSVVTGQHHDVTVYVSTLQHGHPTEFLKDGKYHGFILKYKVEGETEWTQIVSTQLHHVLIFEEELEGKYCVFQAAWVNPRIQNGPWSDQIKELIN
jgi:hypothetical protein